MAECIYIQPAISEQSAGAMLPHLQSQRIIEYASRNYSPVEIKFSSCGKACFALVWSLIHWQFIMGEQK